MAELEELEDYKRCHSLPSEQCEEMEQAWMELVGLQRNIEEIIAILDGKN